MRRAQLIICATLAVSALARHADADAIVVTQAMKASTIAEVFVEEASVRIEIEIGAADVRAFRNVIPDAHYEHLGYAPLPVAERRKTFLTEELVVLADGNRSRQDSR